MKPRKSKKYRTSQDRKKNKSHTKHSLKSRKSRSKKRTKEPSVFLRFAKRVGSGLFYVLTIGLILFALFYTVNRDEDGSIFGYQWYSVLTNSMAPHKNSPQGGFYAGDLIFVEKATFNEVDIGDVVTYRLGNGKNQLTHRLVEKRTEPEQLLITKGDANPSEDAPVKAELLIGKVVCIVPRLGTLISLLKKYWFVWLGLGVIIWTGAQIVAKLQNDKSEKRQVKGGRKVGSSEREEKAKQRAKKKKAGARTADKKKKRSAIC